MPPLCPSTVIPPPALRSATSPPPPPSSRRPPPYLLLQSATSIKFPQFRLSNETFPSPPPRFILMFGVSSHCRPFLPSFLPPRFAALRLQVGAASTTIALTWLLKLQAMKRFGAGGRSDPYIYMVISS
ncbi:ENHANCER OF AG-4 protein 2-like isoform X4 [Salvia miltiorrhiza]|uniref:ENHANCER OF AG-4 protein 2-like isoform X4 n=1 Tax=Salvia miltiorrhiza TaxID=226208 RepID=UPI0025AC1DBE|nr:ENHANCER OF AG-4 protein 2-like isoform X4 [Salvia miltiorrhiza]